MALRVSRPLRKKEGARGAVGPGARPGGKKARQAVPAEGRRASHRGALVLRSRASVLEGGLPPELLKRFRADLSRRATSDRDRTQGTNPRGAEPARGPPRRGRT